MTGQSLATPRKVSFVMQAKVVDLCQVSEMCITLCCLFCGCVNSFV